MYLVSGLSLYLANIVKTVLGKHTINTIHIDQYRLVQTHAIHLTLSSGITSFSDNQIWPTHALSSKKKNSM